MSKKPLYLVIIGPSGGGKGTQAKMLAKKFGLKHLSMGELLRGEIAKESELGEEIARIINQGQWLDTPTTVSVLKPALEESLSSGFILDGFPRQPDQPGALEGLLEENKTDLDLVIHIQVSVEEIMRRRQVLAEKGKGFYPGQKRDDESEESIRGRLQAYQDTIGPILEYYRGKGILVEVDGERAVEPIHGEILELIKKRVKK